MKRVIVHTFRHYNCCGSSETVKVDCPVEEGSFHYVPPIAPRCVNVMGAELYIMGVRPELRP